MTELEQLAADVDETREEQELAGRVLRKMIQGTLYEAKLARAEVAALGERLDAKEEDILGYLGERIGRIEDRFAIALEGADHAIADIRARLSRVEVHIEEHVEEPTFDEPIKPEDVCGPFNGDRALTS